MTIVSNEEADAARLYAAQKEVNRRRT